MIGGRRRRWIAGLVVIAVGSMFALPVTGWREPPRFDGAGYVMLAQALATGHGYRSIDHPAMPSQVNFPPGYPFAMSLLARDGRVPTVTAHAFSVVCGLAATLLAWVWFRGQLPRRAANALGLALGANWIWSRTSGEIQSEAMYELIQMGGLVLGDRLARGKVRRRRLGFVALGVGLGLAGLTRNVAMVLWLAVGGQLVMARAWRGAVGSLAVAAAVAMPWVVWQSSHPDKKQIAYFLDRGLWDVATENLLFYGRRIPDMIWGPFVEVATVFDPRFAMPATIVGLGVSGIVVGGWVRALGSRRGRLGALLGLGTLGLLVVWPFTEAGRFLVPLIPCLLLGATSGLAMVLGRMRVGRPRVRAAWVLLAVSLPYSCYAIVSGRAAAQRERHREFDAACGWIAEHSRPGDLLLTAYPGEAFLQTGRQGLAPPADADDASLEEQLEREPEIAYLLVAPARFANPPDNPLVRYCRSHPDRARLVFGDPETAAVYAVAPAGTGASR